MRRAILEHLACGYLSVTSLAKSKPPSTGLIFRIKRRTRQYRS